jgi:hypothetical protein
MTITNAPPVAVWRFDPRLPSADPGGLHGVLAVSPDETWAVGDVVVKGRARALVVRWTEDFRFATLPAVSPELDVRLNALDRAGDHVWAVGRVADGSGGGRPRIERYPRLPDAPGVAVDGPEVAGDSALHGVAMLSATEGWAVGGSGPGAGTGFTRTLIARWDGRTWTTVPSPNPGTLANRLDAVAARATDDVWAVGHSSSAAGRSEALVLHWDGTAWTRLPIPDLAGAGNRLLGLAPTGPDSLWVVGTATTAGKASGIVLHWNGSTWKSVPTDAAVTQMSAVAAPAEKDVWFAGYLQLPGGPETAYVAHWDGQRLRPEFSGAETEENVASALGGICAAGDRKLAVGWRIARTTHQRPAALFRGTAATT